MLVLLDGARLGAALTFPKNGMILNDSYDLTAVFRIGGTKNGTLLGQAVIIKDMSLGLTFLIT